MDVHSEGSLTAHHGTVMEELTKGSRCPVTIDLLPDVALLAIFDFVVGGEKAWYPLVHVCRKWRSVVFGSPRRLDLRLSCRPLTPVKEKLDIWPPLPIEVTVYTDKMDEIIAALEHNNRICSIDVINPHFPEEKFFPAMQRPFPALTFLELWFDDEIAPLDPDSFLGGSAPCLRTLALEHIPFPGLPKLLLSATYLVDLILWDIPHSGYISPEAMVTCLSALTRIERLDIGFKSPRSFPQFPDRRSQRPPSPTRTPLSILTEFSFSGVCEYSEDLVSRIDAPLLGNLRITFFHRLIFDIPRLTEFISRSPKFKACGDAHVAFSDGKVSVTLLQKFDRALVSRYRSPALTLATSCGHSDWQLSSLAQVCGSSFLHQALVPAVDQLYISGPLHHRHLLPWQDDIECSQWLELLHLFPAVKDLYMSSDFAPRIAPALQELVGERATEVLPVLQRLFLEEIILSGPAQEAIGQFVAARQLASHPITVSHWERSV